MSTGPRGGSPRNVGRTNSSFPVDEREEEAERGRTHEGEVVPVAAERISICPLEHYPISLEWAIGPNDAVAADIA